MLKKMKKEAKKYFKKAMQTAKGTEKIKVILWLLFPGLCGKISEKNI